eukprot:5472940-Pyramimonas_sp.AAC.1
MGVRLAVEGGARRSLQGRAHADWGCVGRIFGCTPPVSRRPLWCTVRSAVRANDASKRAERNFGQWNRS